MSLSEERCEGEESRNEPSSGFVLSPPHALLAAFGPPFEGVRESIVQLAEEAVLVQESLEVHVPSAHAESWLVTLGAQHLEDAHMFELPAGAEEGLAGRVEHEVERIRSARSAYLETLPRDIRHELMSQPRWPSTTVSLAGGAIASVAYGFVETKALVDVSIDTVAEFRRAGFATSCAAAFILHHLGKGQRPVWGAASSNAASLALARSLGFEEVGIQSIQQMPLLSRR